MATKKKTSTHLRAVAGGAKTKTPPARSRQVYASDRPLIQIVFSHELDPKKGLRAEDYVHRTHHENKALEEERRSTLKEKVIDQHVGAARGRSRIYPEINVLNAAKGWYRGIIRLARREGYTDMKKFFNESELVNLADKQLFDAVGAFIEWESKLPTLTRGD